MVETGDFSRMVKILLLVAGVLCTSRSVCSEISSLNSTTDPAINELSLTESPTQDEMSKNNFSFTVVDNCDDKDICVRFCCNNKTSCLKNDFFNLSMLYQAQNLSSEYKVLTGRPCLDMYIEDQSPWAFLQVTQVKLKLQFTRQTLHPYIGWISYAIS